MNFDSLFYTGREVALPKVRQRVNSGLGLGPGPLIQRQLFHCRGLGGSRLREWDLKAYSSAGKLYSTPRGMQQEPGSLN